MKTYKKIKFKKNKINKTKIRGGMQRAATLPLGTSTSQLFKRSKSLPTNYTKITIRPEIVDLIKTKVAEIKKNLRIDPRLPGINPKVQSVMANMQELQSVRYELLRSASVKSILEVGVNPSPLTSIGVMEKWFGEDITKLDFFDSTGELQITTEELNNAFRPLEEADPFLQAHPAAENEEERSAGEIGEAGFGEEVSVGELSQGSAASTEPYVLSLRTNDDPPEPEEEDVGEEAGFGEEGFGEEGSAGQLSQGSTASTQSYNLPPFEQNYDPPEPEELPYDIYQRRVLVQELLAEIQDRLEGNPFDQDLTDLLKDLSKRYDYFDEYIKRHTQFAFNKLKAEVKAKEGKELDPKRVLMLWEPCILNGHSEGTADKITKQFPGLTLAYATRSLLLPTSRLLPQNREQFLGADFPTFIGSSTCVGTFKKKEMEQAIEAMTSRLKKNSPINRGIRSGNLFSDVPLRYVPHIPGIPNNSIEFVNNGEKGNLDTNIIGVYTTRSASTNHVSVDDVLTGNVKNWRDITCNLRLHDFCPGFREMLGEDTECSLTKVLDVVLEYSNGLNTTPQPIEEYDPLLKPDYDYYVVICYKVIAFYCRGERGVGRNYNDRGVLSDTLDADDIREFISKERLHIEQVLQTKKEVLNLATAVKQNVAESQKNEESYYIGLYSHTPDEHLVSLDFNLDLRQEQSILDKYTEGLLITCEAVLIKEKYELYRLQGRDAIAELDGYAEMVIQTEKNIVAIRNLKTRQQIAIQRQPRGELRAEVTAKPIQQNANFALLLSEQSEIKEQLIGVEAPGEEERGAEERGVAMAVELREEPTKHTFDFVPIKPPVKEYRTFLQKVKQYRFEAARKKRETRRRIKQHILEERVKTLKNPDLEAGRLRVEEQKSKLLEQLKKARVKAARVPAARVPAARVAEARIKAAREPAARVAEARVKAAREPAAREPAARVAEESEAASEPHKRTSTPLGSIKPKRGRS